MSVYDIQILLLTYVHTYIYNCTYKYCKALPNKDHVTCEKERFIGIQTTGLPLPPRSGSSSFREFGNLWDPQEQRLMVFPRLYVQTRPVVERRF
jgi:hypothetical protein